MPEETKPVKPEYLSKVKEIKDNPNYLGKVNKFLGYEKSPIRGAATTAALSALAGYLVSSVVGSDKGKGAAIGALSGTALTAPMLIASMARNGKKTAMYSTRNEAVRSQNLWNFVHNTGSFEQRKKDVLADTLREAARIRNIRDMGNAPKGYVTMGDIARAGISAGIGALAAQTLGQVLGASNPRSFQTPGAIFGGLSELGRTTGFIR